MPDTTFENQRDEAYAWLRRSIIFLEREPGEKLSIQGLCEELGLGRTPVRGALLQLQKEGLVNTVPQSGTYVTKIDMNVAESARFVRETVEKEVAGECAARATRADIDKIDQAISLQQSALASNALGDFFVSDNLMHQAIFDIANRSVVWRWLSASNADLERFRLIRTRSPDLDLHGVYEQHLLLRDAIVRHDTTETRYLTAQHLHLMTDEAPAVIQLHPNYFV